MDKGNFHISSGWHTSGGNNTRTGQSFSDIPFPLEITWTFSECSPILGGIITAENTIFFTDNKGTLYALDMEKGTLNWSYSLGGPSYGTPVLNDNKLYIGNSYTALCLHTENGKKIWESNANNPVHREKSANSPLFIDNYVVFCDDFFTIYNAENGDVVMTKSIGSEPHANTGPCADDENIYIPVLKKIEVMSLDRLKKIDTIMVSNKITCGPLIHENYIAVGLNDSSVEVLSLKNKFLSWNYIFSKREYKLVLSRPACIHDMIFAADPFGMVYAFDIVTGHVLWEHHYFERIDSPLVISDNKVIVTGNEYVFALSVKDGEFLWEKGFDSRRVTFPVTSSPAIVKGFLFVGRDKLYAFKKAG
ncbi:MAG: PQQ-binding-like beta-propeller repeat protein [Spirochaetales bacterium]|nr:PQQ-binding-like beta-propeller repeat protein [Spirochaetales bacterium]